LHVRRINTYEVHKYLYIFHKIVSDLPRDAF